jgi:cytochrome c-type biogenesis protein CcmH/NrfG
MLLKQSAMEQQMGDLAAAAESLHKASQLKPDKYGVFLQLGEVEMMLGNTSKARQALSQAVYLRPGVRRKADEIWNKHVKQQREGTRRGPESNE